MKKKIIFDQAYYGFESIVDMPRDLQEMWDERFNPLVKGIPGEFEGIIRVTISYEGDDVKLKDAQ